MSKAVVFTLAIVFALTAWLSAERQQQHASAIYLVTSFDFTAYPVCRAGKTTNCINAIRFYDADSHQSLAEVKAAADMAGRQPIIGTARVSSIPHRVYAVTAYVDRTGRMKEGPPGQITELIHDAGH
jgi:hypothetical protein